MITVKQRLQDVQKRLELRGVKDVKFTYGPNAETATKHQIMEDAAFMLEQYLNGNYTVAGPIGDSVRER